MAIYAKENIAISGTTATYHAAAASDKVSTGPGVFLHVINGDTSPTIVTLTTPGSVEGVAISDPAITVANGTNKFIGPLSRDLFGDRADSYLATVSFSNIVSVTYAVLEA